MSSSSSSSSKYKPTLILHGGAGAITHNSLPPPLYAQYRASLLSYLHSTHTLLNSGTDALTAAVHAVSLMEDDILFNCGKGSVFTEKGTIEMEASVMVSSMRGEENELRGGRMRKRGAGVMQLKRTRHPIRLAKEVLLRTEDDGVDGNPHSQMSGEEVERMGEEWGLEMERPEYFWTERRWKEHLKGLKRGGSSKVQMDHDDADEKEKEAEDDKIIFSQGTVGAVCMDANGDLAVATSTGGLTNKKVGRIGDTPTIGCGYWAEGWDEAIHAATDLPKVVDEWQIRKREDQAYQRGLAEAEARFQRMPSFEMTNALKDCLPGLFQQRSDELYTRISHHDHRPGEKSHPTTMAKPVRRRAVAMSGTGNGDSFLRVAAARTAAAMARFSTPRLPLSDAVTAVAGPNGELQRSAGNRWLQTGEGQGGIIGIEVLHGDRKGSVVFDFNCGGMYRAWVDNETGEERMRVFKGTYGDGPTQGIKI